MLRALIWDVDGTLAETEHHGHLVAFNQAFADEGLDWHWDEALYRELLAITGGKERMLAWWQRLDAAAAATPEASQRIARLHARKTAIYVALVEQGRVALRPGVRRLLAEARDQGLTLAIATTTSPANVDALLHATLGPGSGGWFACIGAGDVVPHKKPAPDIYQWVLRRLGLSAGDCLAIEDSAPGVQAARAAGLPVLATRSRYSRGDRLPPVLADLDGLGEPGQPAAGQWSGQPWQGWVTVDGLRHALSTAPAGSSPGVDDR
jgi:beta-phosphoglucomutase-like phosphatase (HAD superfamily)